MKEIVSECCLVQYYDISRNKTFSVNKIESAFICVGLQWYRKQTVAGKLSASRASGVVHV